MENRKGQTDGQEKWGEKNFGCFGTKGSRYVRKKLTNENCQFHSECGCVGSKYVHLFRTKGQDKNFPTTTSNGGQRQGHFDDKLPQK